MEIKWSNVTPFVNELYLETYSKLEINQLRAMDTIHIACDIEWNVDIFVTSDQQQAKAARKSD